ncbi:hypothetical protein C8Q73DRAFT_102584 [Cubamyces lactineus]|nr:hypothetical protein C8Q73DRAFT_102584 [Cubamyces lactineus]
MSIAQYVLAYSAGISHRRLRHGVPEYDTLQHNEYEGASTGMSKMVSSSRFSLGHGRLLSFHCVDGRYVVLVLLRHYRMHHFLWLAYGIARSHMATQTRKAGAPTHHPIHHLVFSARFLIGTSCSRGPYEVHTVFNHYHLLCKSASRWRRLGWAGWRCLLTLAPVSTASPFVQVVPPAPSLRSSFYYGFLDPGATAGFRCVKASVSLPCLTCQAD